MLKFLEMRNVGPAAAMTLDSIAPRFNLVTGDNGLGKSFLLDIAWWALTGTWHEVPAVPSTPEASIKYAFDGETRIHRHKADWDISGQRWRRSGGRPPNPGLVLYARIDGSFSVWDPARNYRLYQRADGGDAESPGAYQFTPNQVSEGLRRRVFEAGIEREQVLCRGMIDDWTRWQEQNAPQFVLLRRLLEHLGPDEQPIEPGTPWRPTLDDQRRIPTIRMPYGQDVPLTYAPAGVRRMAKLAYLLSWALWEHREQATRIGQPLSRQFIVLFDEPETHLHPRWQRTVLPSLHKAIEGWDEAHHAEVQFLVATHAPLVLASMEPIFHASKDALWKLDLAGSDVRIELDAWRKRGNADRWLVSDVFDLGEATSREAERVLTEARALLGSVDPAADEVRRVDELLGKLLPEMDPFFVRWRHYLGSVLVSANGVGEQA